MKIFSKSDVGLIRKANQDSYFVGEISDESVFAIVCDGMGGAKAGNVASEVAVKHISDYIIKSFRDNMSITDIQKMLLNSIKSSNIELYDMSVSDSDLSGMGTTVVLAFVNKRQAVIAHVGDSRIYLLNNDIVQLTRDHSVVQTLIESGKISIEDAKVHPRKNVITRALGAEEEVSVDCSIVDITDGDTLLLCSDGLTNYVETKEILNIYKNNKISETPEMLVKSANSAGGGDNITVVTITA